MDGFEVVGLLLALHELLEPALAAIVVLVTHSVSTHVERQTQGHRRVLHVAPALHNVLWRDVKGSRAILLLETTAEVASMVVLPLDDAGDLVHKFGG